MFHRCSLIRVLLILAVVLSSIQILHVILASLLQTERDATRARFPNDAINRLIQAVETSQVMDSSGQYRIVNNLIKSKMSGHLPTETGYNTETMVTLVSQCSVNHLHHLINLLPAWQGPISVAVFVTNRELASTLGTVLKLLQCKPELFSYVSLHLVYGLELPTEKIDLDSYSLPDGTDCQNIRQTLEGRNLGVGNYAWKNSAYPTNLLRNVALENAIGDYVFVVDMDMLPSHGLYHKLTDFIHKFLRDGTSRSGQFAFVVPAFEIRDSISVPGSKKELLELWRQRNLRPFYEELCWKCQRHTNYSAWRDLVLSDLLHVGYIATWKDPWEPFYVMPKSAPKYDERFRQYGFNRISQSCELHIAGFQFFVLDNAFLVHRGFKTAQDFHRSKEIEQNENRLLFRKFKEELKVKYSETDRRCY